VNTNDEVDNIITGILQDGKMEAEKIGLRLGIQAYAVRFLKYDCNISYQPVLANSPTTPDRIHDIGMLEKYCEDELSEVWMLVLSS